MRMRILDMSLLHSDLVDRKLPLRSLGTSKSASSANRSTYLPYFDVYLQFTWSKEPPDNYLEVIRSVVSKHANLEIDGNSFVDCKGSFPKQASASTKAKPEEDPFEFEAGISEEVIPTLVALIASGRRIERYQSPSDGRVSEFMKGGDDAILRSLHKKLEEVLPLEKLQNAGITYWRGSSGSPVSSSLIADWLVEAAMKFGVEDSPKIVNRFLLEPNHTVLNVHCIDGFNVNASSQLLPKLKLKTIDEIEHFPNFKQLFDFRPSTIGRVRRPSAALVLQTLRPKFVSAEKLMTYFSEVEFDEVLSILTLFGPSAPSHVANFSEVVDSPFSVNTSGLGYGLSDDEYADHQTPFAPDLQEFGDTYTKYNKLSGKSRNRVKIALNRLNRALRRKDKTNKSLEIGIALESILLSGKDEDGSSGEISYRLASRGAWLVGTTSEDRYRIFGILKAAYTLRSKAAHEGQVPKSIKGVVKGEKPWPTTYLLQDSCNLCAQAILKIIQKGDVTNWTQLVLGDID